MATIKKARPTPRPGRPSTSSRTGRPIMALLDLIGRRWALRLIWELRGGALTFRALQQACDGVSPSVLNDRLAELREVRLVGVVEGGYALTALGMELVEALAPVRRWSDKWARALAG